MEDVFTLPSLVVWRLEVSAPFDANWEGATSSPAKSHGDQVMRAVKLACNKHGSAWTPLRSMRV